MPVGGEMQAATSSRKIPGFEPPPSSTRLAMRKSGSPRKLPPMPLAMWSFTLLIIYSRWGRLLDNSFKEVMESKLIKRIEELEHDLKKAKSGFAGDATGGCDDVRVRG